LRLFERGLKPYASDGDAVPPRGLEDVESRGTPGVGVVEDELPRSTREPSVELLAKLRESPSFEIAVEQLVAAFEEARGECGLSRPRVSGEENDFADSGSGASFFRGMLSSRAAGNARSSSSRSS
jgi:hypothetical protein